MIELSTREARVLGVLVEKAHTTPAQYPMTLNALVSGCNQKSNRDPVVQYSEDQILEALDGLRGKGLAAQVELSGSRVSKFRHLAREGFGVATPELVVLTELLLRGPQTAGELRSRAMRMHPLESMDVVVNVLANMMNREEPLVQRLAPAPGSRAERYAQLLCPKLNVGRGEPVAAMHTPTAEQQIARSSAPAGEVQAGADVHNLLERMNALELEVEHLRKGLQRLANMSGQPNPLIDSD